MHKLFKYLIVLALIVPINLSFAAEEDNIKNIFSSLEFRSTITPVEILIDLEKLDNLIREDFTKNRIPNLVSQLGTQKVVYSLSDMSADRLNEIASEAFAPMYEKTVHEVKVNYFKLLFKNDLITTEEFNLYTYLLG